MQFSLAVFTQPTKLIVFLAENTSLRNHTFGIPSKPFLAEKFSDFNDLYPFSLRIYDTNCVSTRHVVNRLVAR